MEGIQFDPSPKVNVNSGTLFLLPWLALQSLLFVSKALGFGFKINQCFQLYISHEEKNKISTCFCSVQKQ
jgi:hypothetical protein